MAPPGPPRAAPGRIPRRQRRSATGVAGAGRSSAVRRVLGLVAILALVGFGVQVLQEATEYHGGAGQHGVQTTVTFHVATKNYHHSDDIAAVALWQTCVGSIG